MQIEGGFAICKYFFSQRVGSKQTIPAGMPECGVIRIPRMIKNGNTHGIMVYDPIHLAPGSSCAPSRVPLFTFTGQVISAGNGIAFYCREIAFTIGECLVFRSRNL